MSKMGASQRRSRLTVIRNRLASARGKVASRSTGDPLVADLIEVIGLLADLVEDGEPTIGLALSRAEEAAKKEKTKP